MHVCVLFVYEKALTEAPGCPVCVSERSSCSPEWTTPGSVSLLHHGRFLCKQRNKGQFVYNLMCYCIKPRSSTPYTCVFVCLTCFHEASQSSLHHSGSAVDVFLLRVQRCQLAHHILTGVLQTLTTSPISHTHTYTQSYMNIHRTKTSRKSGKRGKERGNHGNKKKR